MRLPDPATLLAVVLAACCLLAVPGPAMATTEPGGDATFAATTGPDRPPRNATAALGNATPPTTATVVGVPAGDVLLLRVPGGGTTRLRLLGVDAPDRRFAPDPTKFPGVPNTHEARTCLSTATDEARTLLSNRLAGREVEVRLDPEVGTRDAAGRLLGDAVVADRSVSRLVVELGYGLSTAVTDRPAGTGTTVSERQARADSYAAAETAAREAGRGLWGCESLTYRTADRTGDNPAIELVRQNAAGDDESGAEFTNLNREFVVFNNTRDSVLELGGWTVTDSDGFRYTFPEDFALGRHGTVVLHTGRGEDGGDHLFWNSDRPVWDDVGDVVVVRRPNGSVELYQQYGTALADGRDDRGDEDDDG